MAQRTEIEAMTTIDLYAESWKIYKAHSEVFVDDLEFYYNFCNNKKTLELFAGYGRISNYLRDHNIDLETVELSPSFASFINISKEKNHVVNVLDFRPKQKFECIIAGYNSFCLLKTEKDAFTFFSLLDSWTAPGGRVALSYYHSDFWHQAVEYSFEYQNQKVVYTPSFDLSKKEHREGLWVDKYTFPGGSFTHDYSLRLYDNPQDILDCIRHTGFRLVEIIENFNKEKEDILEPGWIDYVLEKQH